MVKGEAGEVSWLLSCQRILALFCRHTVAFEMLQANDNVTFALEGGVSTGWRLEIHSAKNLTAMNKIAPHTKFFWL